MATHSSVLAWRIQGQQSLVGCHLWGHTELDTTEVTQQQQKKQRDSTITITKIIILKQLGLRLSRICFPNLNLDPRPLAAAYLQALLHIPSISHTTTTRHSPTGVLCSSTCHEDQIHSVSDSQLFFFFNHCYYVSTSCLYFSNPHKPLAFLLSPSPTLPSPSQTPSEYSTPCSANLAMLLTFLPNIFPTSMLSQKE